MVDVSRLGQIAATGDDNALFLKRFSGEVLGAFLEANKMMPLHMVKTLDSGKSAQFPVTGIAYAKWHTPGDSVITDTDASAVNYLNKIKANEKEIFIDDKIVSPVLIDDLDKLKNHWDHRKEYVRAIAHSLAKQADEHVIATLLATARSAETITGETGATTTVNVATGTGQEMVEAAYDAAEQLDDNDVPAEDRYFLVRNAEYYKMLEEKSLLDKDYSDGSGDFARGNLWRVAGMQIVRTNNMPTTDLSAVTDTGARNDVFGGSGIGYNGDFSSVKALAFHRSACGTVKMKDLAMESSRETERLADLLVASYAMGHGVLRPECAVEIATP